MSATSSTPLTTLLLQDVPSQETRAAMAGALLQEHPVEVLRVPMAGLTHETVAPRLRSGSALPVGTVEFVREALRAAGITEPWNMSYPHELQRYLRRDVHRVLAGEVRGRWFVKPLSTKAFTGFVFNSGADPSLLTPEMREQHEAFSALPATVPVWISAPVEFVSEWRFYVRDRKVIGEARYDPDGADEAPEPDSDTVREAAESLPTAQPCALDFGVLRSGETALVEVNDAWALGLYGGALSGREYLEFLWARWVGLAHAARHNARNAQARP